MKILLNENEMYEIKMPEQISLEELPMIVTRFNSLLKNFSKFNLVLKPLEELQDENDFDNDRIPKKQNREQWEKLRRDRNLFLSLLDTYYNKTNEEFEAFKLKNNMDIIRNNMSGIQMTRIRELHNIRPSELNLIKFPSRTETLEQVRIRK